MRHELMHSLVWLRYNRLCCNETQQSVEMSTEMHCTNQTSSSLPANTRRILNGVGRCGIKINCLNSQLSQTWKKFANRKHYSHTRSDVPVVPLIFDAIQITVAAHVCVRAHRPIY